MNLVEALSQPALSNLALNISQKLKPAPLEGAESTSAAQLLGEATRTAGEAAGALASATGLAPQKNDPAVVAAAAVGNAATAVAHVVAERAALAFRLGRYGGSGGREGSGGSTDSSCGEQSH